MLWLLFEIIQIGNFYKIKFWNYIVIVSLVTMNISNFISKRYLFAKKSRNVINLISLISLFGLLVSAASLVVILSGFNGIQKYVEDVYGKFSASKEGRRVDQGTIRRRWGETFGFLPNSNIPIFFNLNENCCWDLKLILIFLAASELMMNI